MSACTKGSRTWSAPHVRLHEGIADMERVHVRLHEGRADIERLRVRLPEGIADMQALPVPPDGQRPPPLGVRPGQLATRVASYRELVRLLLQIVPSPLEVRRLHRSRSPQEDAMRHPYEDEFDGMDWQSQRDRDEWRARREGYSGRPGYTGGYARDYAYGQSRPAGPGPGYFAGPRYGEHDRGRFGRGPMIVGDARRPTEDETFAERLGDFGYKVAHDIKAIFRGPKGYKRGDERIREDVCDRLNHVAQHAQADLGDVEISVKDGEVTVAGLVAHRRIKRMVEDVIEGVVGVVDIHNQLRVKPAEQHPSDHANAGASAGTPSDNGTRRPLERSPQTSGRPAP